MARYYCEYCHSYLTHDTLSVRKSHLIGKNHLRIVGDYYRNKAAHEPHCRARPQKHSTHAAAAAAGPIKCASNREKKRRARAARYHLKELQADTTSALQQIYDGSPGYSKVFVAANRLDIGDLVRASRLPQRANAAEPPSAAPTRSRNELYRPALEREALEPPRVLAQWHSTVPKQTLYHDPALLAAAAHHAKTSMQAKKRKN